MDICLSKEQISRFWKKKEFVSFVLSILVFFIHVSSLGQYSSSNEALVEVKSRMAFFLNESITRFAVPMFFIISGLVFYRDYDNSKYLSKVKSRFFSLCIPYLIWNTVWMIFDIICSYTFISSFFTGRVPFELTFTNVIRSVFLAESNGPFWFVMYLIIFVFLAPVIDMIAKNKYVGAVTVVAITILASFPFAESSIIKIDAIVFYLLGAILGKHHFEFFVKRTSTVSRITSCAFLIIYILAKNIFRANDYIGKPSVKIIIFALASYAMWSMVDLFIDKIKHRPIYSRSFPIFAMHINISAVICKIIYLLLPKSIYFALPNLLLTVSLTLLLINVFCYLLSRYLPSVYALLMGKGINKQKKKVEITN